MKQVELGNNVNVEITDEGYKIISASGSEIMLDCMGEFLGYTNQTGMKQLKKRKEFLEKFSKINDGIRKDIFEWLRSCDGAENEMQENFFFWLGQAMAEVEYEYYIGEFFDPDAMIDVMNGYQEILPGYSLEDATKSEEILWLAYKIAKGDWTFVEALLYNRMKNKTLYVLKK